MKLRSLALLMLTSAFLAGCVTSGDFCDVSAPIRPSVDDVLTTGTASQILAHNETGARLCRWR